MAFEVTKIVFREVGVGFKELAIALTKGKEARAEARLTRLLKLFKADIVPATELAGHEKFKLLKQHVAEMAHKAGIVPPEIVVLRNEFIPLGAPTKKTMLVSMHELESSSSAELKALSGHELGHVKRGDHLVGARALNHTSEYEADRIGVELSGEPTAMISWLKRTAKTNPMAEGTLVYPKHSDRIKKILERGANGVHVAPKSISKELGG